jgi:hypothetical protein
MLPNCCIPMTLERILGDSYDYLCYIMVPNIVDISDNIDNIAVISR